ncbi:hypothetical protein INP83_17545 [Mucilaginibacter sp. 21P]|uniref:hypothetical protein n=1 Tax=Mucilaginibacter sp. 21P TaxID=2778902 RepID=UPI001C5918E3|nr:hypothetical protein [Mucilaginibacter sp. 21P]QXV64868.1 hypothetical protein INP83_17545 [Mucilaginibacter sp. 21P]
MRYFTIAIAILCFFVSNKVYAQGCLIPNYDPYNKVFNVPTSTGARTFLAGNGRNFVLWQGVCGPHTYVATTSSPNGSCTVQGITQTGTYYPTVSTPFTSPCPVPLDDHIWVVLFLTFILSFFMLKQNNTNHVKT